MAAKIFVISALIAVLVSFAKCDLTVAPVFSKCGAHPIITEDLPHMKLGPYPPTVPGSFNLSVPFHLSAKHNYSASQVTLTQIQHGFNFFGTIVWVNLCEYIPRICDPIQICPGHDTLCNGLAEPGDHTVNSAYTISSEDINNLPEYARKEFAGEYKANVELRDGATLLACVKANFNARN